MNNKKLITLLCFSLLSFISSCVYADDLLSQHTQAFKEIKGISAYQATIIGYAISCDIKKDTVETVKSQFVSIINNIGLTQNDYEEVQKIFMHTLIVAKEKGPSNSGLTCSQFQIEFNKIYNSIKAGHTE
jgi:hypothetical protein